MNMRHYLPLVGFVVPTVIIGYGFVIPRSCIAGVNELTVGFASSTVGACVTYYFRFAHSSERSPAGTVLTGEVVAGPAT